MADGGKRLEEAFRGLVADYAQAGNLAALRVEEDDARRPEEREAFEERPILRVRGGDVRLQEQHAIELGAHARIGESEFLHLFARHAPVRIEVEHRRPAWRRKPLVELRYGSDASEGDAARALTAGESARRDGQARDDRRDAGGLPRTRSR